MELRAKLANNLKRMREEQGLSQEEFAHRAGLHRTYVSMVERQTSAPSITVLEKIAKGLGVEAWEVLR